MAPGPATADEREQQIRELVAAAERHWRKTGFEEMTAEERTQWYRDGAAAFELHRDGAKHLAWLLDALTDAREETEAWRREASQQLSRSLQAEAQLAAARKGEAIFREELEREHSRLNAAQERERELREALERTDALMWEWAGETGHDEEPDGTWRPLSVRERRRLNAELVARAALAGEGGERIVTEPPRQPPKANARRRWNVWSKDPSRDAWLVVEPKVSEAEAKAGVERRMATARRRGMEGVEFMALPAGQTPHQVLAGEGGDET